MKKIYETSAAVIMLLIIGLVYYNIDDKSYMGLMMSLIVSLFIYAGLYYLYEITSILVKFLVRVVINIIKTIK